jgi:hypothetical protein
MRYTIVSEKERQSILEMHSRNKKAVNEDMVPNAAAPQATAQPVAVGPKPQVRTASEFAVMIGNMGYSKELMDPKYFTPLNVNIYAEEDPKSGNTHLVVNLNSKYKDENKFGTYIIK